MQTRPLKFKCVYSDGATTQSTIIEISIEHPQTIPPTLSPSIWLGYKLQSINQFTGITDINGNEVYENDVVNAGNEPYDYQIRWNAHRACWSMYNMDTWYNINQDVIKLKGE